MLCKLEDALVCPASLTMMMFHGDTLMKRLNDIIDRVVEAGLYNYWISIQFNSYKISSRIIILVRQINGYYGFYLYHLQTVFNLLLIVWCLSALCHLFEVLYNRVLNKIMCSSLRFGCNVNFNFGVVYTVLRQPRAIIFCLSKSQWRNGGFRFFITSCLPPLLFMCLHLGM
jgi:hypothetical protein